MVRTGDVARNIWPSFSITGDEWTPESGRAIPKFGRMKAAKCDKAEESCCIFFNWVWSTSEQCNSTDRKERRHKEQRWKNSGEEKTQIRDNQAWSSCAKFTAVIWNPTALASGWRGRQSRLSFARNRPTLGGAFLSLLLSPQCSSILHGAQMKTCATRQAAYLHYTWAAGLEVTTPWGIISIARGKKGKRGFIDPADKEKGIFLLCVTLSSFHCSAFPLITVCDIFISTPHANVLLGIFSTHFQGPHTWMRLPDERLRLNNSLPVGRDHVAETSAAVSSLASFPIRALQKPEVHLLFMYLLI